MAKLTDRQRKRIIAEYVQGGISQRKLAEKYQVTQKTISTILKDEEVRQKVLDKKEENTRDMLAFLTERTSSAMVLIDEILVAAAQKIKKAPLRDQMGAIKILSEVFGKTGGGSNGSNEPVTEIIIQAEDASKPEDAEGEDATDN